MIDRICQWCDKAFAVYPAHLRKKGGGKFCSKKCYFEKRKSGIPIVLCQYCNKEFSVLKRDIHRGGGKYCSRACFYLAIQKKWADLTCLYCGNNFKREKCIVGISNNKYCCFQCSVEDKKRKTNLLVKCEYCGMEFKRIISNINKTEKSFCSQVCFQKWNVGENNPSWIDRKDFDTLNIRNLKEYKEWRLTVYEKYNYKCWVCESREDITAHHFYGYTEFPDKRIDIDNGVVLCQRCHVGYHAYILSKKLSIIPDNFISGDWIECRA